MNEEAANMDQIKETFGNVIHAYTRADALADGVLVDVSEMAREAGFVYPVAITRAVFEILDPSPELSKKHAQDFKGRLWDVLTVFHWTARRTRGNIITFVPLVFQDTRDKSPKPLLLKGVCGPGDDMEPVVTVKLPDED